ncbi:MAG TPA: AI-2E family transporter [Candidatus Stercorousia faecigallinarum]|nr:AI-2E family transporter [Candidatus Stercorousia faecigallinarum]
MLNKRFWTSKNLIFTGLVIVLLLILPKIVGILMLFFGAYVIACALNPYVTKLMVKMKNRTAASSLVILSSVLAIIALFIPIVFVAYKEIKTFLITLPEKITDVTNFLLHAEFYGHKIPEMLDPETILGNSSSFAQGLVNQSWSLTVSLFQLLMVSVALTMIVYYILVDKAYLKKKFLQFFPPDLKEKADEILTNISNKVGGYVRAQILSMAAVGVMMAVVLVVLGVEYATLLGLITGILDIVPILGPTIALGIIILVAYPAGLVKIILIIIGFLLVQQISNYVVRPVLFGKLMELHPLMIFLALFLAEQFLGFWGVILSPAIAATICVLIDELYLAPINLKTKESDE